MRRCLCRLQSRPLLTTQNCERLVELGFTSRRHPCLNLQHAFSALHFRKLRPAAAQAGSPSGAVKPQSPPRQLPTSSPLKKSKSERSASIPKPLNSKVKASDSKTKASIDAQSDIQTWVSRLDKYLPKALRLVDKEEPTLIFQNEDTAKEILVLLTLCYRKTNVDLLSYMVLSQGRHDAVLHLADFLLTSSSSTFALESDELPSNLQWSIPFRDNFIPRIDFDETSFHPGRSSPWPSPFQESADARGKEKPMQAILFTLAKLTLTASKQNEKANDATMRTVLRIIARMHNLDLIPSEVYDYSLPWGPTTIQRPPIMHLLSSRILTSISDAVWNSQQDEAIAQALSSGQSRFQVGRSVPGGPVRPRVSKLRPEVWLEFLLWCCVDGGYTSTGARIINLLQQERGDPWFPVHWCSDEPLDGTAPKVNWAKAKRRFGGPVGRLEGYSNDKPLAEIPPRTISTEVVVALVESFFSSLNVGIKGSGLSTNKVQQGLLDVIKFLEPHYLGSGYFDYLTIRFLQCGCISMANQPDVLREWTSAMSQMRLMKTVRPRPTLQVNFELDTVMTHSELQVGILQQVLQGQIDRHNTVQAVETFAQIQQHVDLSKLESMDRFLTGDQVAPTTMRPRGEISDARQDYVASHGQLPLYRLAGFLNLVTDARLFGLGDWLRNSRDIDGPLIPVQDFPHLSMIVALIKYADKTKDAPLIRSVISTREKWRLKPSVNTLRALVNAMVSISDWHAADKTLQTLKDAQGGGYGLRNVTRIAAKVRFAEAQVEQGREVELHQREVENGFRMLFDILSGKYDGGHADLRTKIRREFYQQIGFILRIFENTRSGMLQELARTFMSMYPSSNQPRLAPGLFNDLLGMVVETDGAAEGRRLFLLFCRDPMSYPSHEGELQVIDDLVIPVGSSVENDSDHDSYLPQTQSTKGPDVWQRIEAIPFEKANSGDIATNTSSSRTKQSFNPIVIPNLQTLHIIVRRTLLEKAELRGAMQDREGELYHILRWAEHYYKAFGVSRQDIEAETQLPPSLQNTKLSLAQLRRMYSSDRKQLNISERGRVSISGQFLSNGGTTRMPRLPRFGDQSIRLIPRKHPWGEKDKISFENDKTSSEKDKTSLGGAVE